MFTPHYDRAIYRLLLVLLLIFSLVLLALLVVLLALRIFLIFSLLGRHVRHFLLLLHAGDEPRHLVHHAARHVLKRKNILIVRKKYFFSVRSSRSQRVKSFKKCISDILVSDIVDRNITIY